MISDHIPFPQANDLTKIVEIRNLLPKNKSLVKKAIQEYFNFSSRQAGYYFSACLWFGLYVVSSNNDVVSRVEGKNVHEYLRNKFSSNVILSNALQNQHLTRKIQVELIVNDLILHSNMSTMITTTHYRRASTVLKWVEYFNSMNND